MAALRRVYRHLNQADEYAESVVIAYDKGVVTSSMSKVWSLAGIRLGWCVTRTNSCAEAFCPIATTTSSPAACSTRPWAPTRGPCRRHPRPQPPHRAREFGYAFGMGGIGPHLSVVPPEAGTTALVYYDYDIPSYDFCTDMVKFSSAFVTPGDCFEPKSFAWATATPRYGQLREQRRDRARTGRGRLRLDHVLGELGDVLVGRCRAARAPRTSRSSTRRAPRCDVPVPRSPWTPPRGWIGTVAEL
ncbi:MAG: hypothetical protein ACLUW6_06580 [Coriobacteriaceae bacterium]